MRIKKQHIKSFSISISVIIIAIIFFSIFGTIEYSGYSDGAFGEHTYLDGGVGEIEIPSNTYWEYVLKVKNIEGTLICNIYNETYEFGKGELLGKDAQIIKALTISEAGTYTIALEPSKESRIVYVHEYVTENSEARVSSDIGVRKKLWKQVLEKIL